MSSPPSESGSPAKPAAVSAEVRSPDSFVRFNREEAERLRRTVEWKVFELCSILIGDCSNIEIDERKLVREAQTWLQPRHCTDIVEERSTDGRCGWAFCSRELRAGGPTGLRIAYREKRVYEVKNSSLFCCGSCLEKAMLFQASLKDTPPLSRPEVTSLPLMLADPGIDGIISLLSPQSVQNRQQGGEGGGADQPSPEDRPPPAFQNAAIGVGGALVAPVVGGGGGKGQRQLPDRLLVRERSDPDVKIEFVDGGDYYEPAYPRPAPAPAAERPSSSSSSSTLGAGGAGEGKVKVWVEDQFSAPQAPVYTAAAVAAPAASRAGLSLAKDAAVLAAGSSGAASAGSPAGGASLSEGAGGAVATETWLESRGGSRLQKRPLKSNIVSWHGGAVDRAREVAPAGAAAPAAAAVVAPPARVVEFTTLAGRVLAYPVEQPASRSPLPSPVDSGGEEEKEDEEAPAAEDFLYGEEEEEDEEAPAAEDFLYGEEEEEDSARFGELAGLQALQMQLRRSVVREEAREEKSIFLRVLTALSDLFAEGGALLQAGGAGQDPYAELAAAAPERQILDAGGQAVRAAIGAFLRRGLTSAEMAIDVRRLLRGRKDAGGQEAIVAYELAKNRLLAGATYPSTCPALSSSEWSFVGLLLADAVLRRGGLLGDAMALVAYDVLATTQFAAVMAHSCRNGKVRDHDLRLLREYFFR